MGLFSTLKNLVSTPGARLASPDPHAVKVEVDSLAVHTAEELIILVTSPAGATVLAVVGRSGEPARLSGPEVTVHLSPTGAQQRAVHDPSKGWVIPLNASEQQRLAELSAVPGDYEISDALAVSIEDA